MRKARANRSLPLFATVLLLLVSACSERKPSDVLDPSKLEAVLYDYHLVQSIINDMPSSERYKKDLFFDYVFDKHEVTRAEFDSSLVYYARYPETLSEVYVRLSERIAHDIQRIEESELPEVKREPISVAGDSVDLWYDTRVIPLTSSPLASRFTFTIPADTNFRPGDHIAWGGEAILLHTVSDSLRHYLYLNLTVTYANDSVQVADTLMYASGDYRLSVADTTDVMVKSIKGTAYLKGHDASHQALMVHPHLLREHKKD